MGLRRNSACRSLPKHLRQKPCLVQGLLLPARTAAPSPKVPFRPTSTFSTTSINVSPRELRNDTEPFDTRERDRDRTLNPFNSQP
ncbi:hypothetical protein VTJ04DRAFT_1509 [Mycothermus thermophilus]|uniref:uncharacterized protein n=1 Tax=Humicola insolens TaxID=85995 RepID=UPI0037432756